METSPRELMGLKIITLFSCFDSMNVSLSQPNLKDWNIFGFARRRTEDVQKEKKTKLKHMADIVVLPIYGQYSLM